MAALKGAVGHYKIAGANATLHIVAPLKCTAGQYRFKGGAALLVFHLSNAFTAKFGFMWMATANAHNPSV